ncbi:MAG: hypothetical protein GY820_18940, partial [Gammaproteobacteria bacterium]|nr:hypothetical protein [Gammaproteobacteria bacterium]
DEIWYRIEAVARSNFSVSLSVMPYRQIGHIRGVYHLIDPGGFFPKRIE